MIGRIEKKFGDLKQKNRKALVVYLTAGDPDLETTRRLASSLQEAGADILEIGVPFSDPTADGPIIQVASQRALRAGVTLSGILDMIETLRNDCQIPIVLFGYYNPIFSYGSERFALRAKKVGVDGILVVDLPQEESHELRQYTDRTGIDFISLVAPTTNDQRIRHISKKATGFLYYISITGVTGTAKPLIENIEADVARIRRITALPLVIGFGISTPVQAAEIASYADGIVIGSAFVDLIGKNSGNENLIQIASSFVRDIKSALK
ncbi:MAG TPA: tryptophan synthase subunit alpha [Syntrophales bacterium]|nr:tryptophan synthase subunit alpha [Syntrophales bacterium]